jgi:hypothetical protein
MYNLQGHNSYKPISSNNRDFLQFINDEVETTITDKLTFIR